MQANKHAHTYTQSALLTHFLHGNTYWFTRRPDCWCCVYSQHEKSLLDSSKSHFDSSIFLKLLYMKQSRHTHICSHSLSPPLRCNTPTHESLSSSHRKHLLPRCPDVASPSLSYFFIFPPLSLSLSYARFTSLPLTPSCGFPLPVLQRSIPLLFSVPPTPFSFLLLFLLQCIFELPSFISPQFHDLFLFPFCPSKSNKIQWHEMTVLITEKIDCKALEILSKIRHGLHSLEVKTFFSVGIQWLFFYVLLYTYACSTCGKLAVRMRRNQFQQGSRQRKRFKPVHHSRNNVRPDF